MANKAIVGEKVGMTQVWDDANRVVPVTVVSVRPCRVVQVKTPTTDGYGALQVTYGTRPARKLTKAPAASTGPPARSAPAPRRPASSRAPAWPAARGPSGSPR